MHFTVAQPFHLPTQIPEQQRVAGGKRQAASGKRRLGPKSTLANNSNNNSSRNTLANNNMTGKCCMSQPQRYTHSHTATPTARAKPVAAFVVACFINVCCAKASQVALDAASAVRAVRHAWPSCLPLAAQAIACHAVRTS